MFEIGIFLNALEDDHQKHVSMTGWAERLRKRVTTGSGGRRADLHTPCAFFSQYASKPCAQTELSRAAGGGVRATAVAIRGLGGVRKGGSYRGRSVSKNGDHRLGCT